MKFDRSIAYNVGRNATWCGDVAVALESETIITFIKNNCQV